jgi:hypothetical protein
MPDERQPLPDPHEPGWQEAGQARLDFASIESDLDFLMRRVNHLPTASDLWRAALLIALIGGVLGLIGLKNFWPYFPSYDPG